MTIRTDTQSPLTPAEVQAALAEPFPSETIGWKAQMVKGNRALAVPYIDARDVEQRLDDVLGIDGWRDDYTVLDGGAVACRLSLKIGETWIAKMDVGAPSEQPDGGDRMKAAFSDALKRAGVKWGIGRYLYALPAVWADYDPQKKQFMRTPALPPAAVPAAETPKAPASAPAPAKGQTNGGAMPADGPEFAQRLREYDAKLAKQGVWESGALVQHVTQEGVKAGYGADLAAWAGAAITFAAQTTLKFEEAQRRLRPAAAR
jgi:hypothetical protein